jgi:hypothetical protein
VFLLCSWLIQGARKILGKPLHAISYAYIRHAISKCIKMRKKALKNIFTVLGYAAAEKAKTFADDVLFCKSVNPSSDRMAGNAKTLADATNASASPQHQAYAGSYKINRKPLMMV